MSVTLDRKDDCAIVTLDRPGKLNALSFSLIAELDAVLDQAASMPVRALVVTGAGEKAFCAGADIEELRGRSQTEQQRGAELGQAVFERLSHFPVPSIAAIKGYAFGGGLELAMACTFRIAARTARLSLPEIKLGLIPGYGGTQRLPRLVGEARAMELILTGRMVDAVEAFQIGLVNRVADGEPVAAAIEFAGAFMRHGLVALRLARSAVARALDNPIQVGLKIEADLSTLAYQTRDSEEGMAAFLEKRKPEFRDA
ncbi:MULTISPECIES: enoyl-CoA hydratase-related protein [unclassified Mesorhizobium]|uniref:enoyl-CoA hydratase/isomerase family protein n=1 Tax=unclassified Mesorhizobium TaxID=325217 RepID=UPI002417378E|nr:MULTISPECIES: enoyl-CoA hydratase-related protein [unclassified Mesorhizobium]WFP65562.1 enoyl-CoA hydratase-related protein [Mesorhizobium sp. WSM4904]WFP78827.1 enoyl-CoA hydratase-related protein [Mesorhizobium sp. WSM4906]